MQIKKHSDLRGGPDIGFQGAQHRPQGARRQSARPNGQHRSPGVSTDLQGGRGACAPGVLQRGAIDLGWGDRGLQSIAIASRRLGSKVGRHGINLGWRDCDLQQSSGCSKLNGS